MIRNRIRTLSLPAFSKAGFTLVELLIFSAIFSIIAVSFFGALVSVIQVQTRQNAVAEVNQQSQFLLETIQRYVERSSIVELPSDTATTTLKLRMASSTSDPTYIYLSGTAVYYKETDSGVGQPLTSDRVTVSNLLFTKRANPPGHDSVNVVFTVAYNTTNIKRAFLQALQISVARVSAATFDSNVIPSANNTFSLGVTSQGWQSINNLIYFSGSNVGIGTASPGWQLDLTGALNFRGMSAPATSTAGQAVFYFDSSSNQLKLSQNAGAYSTIGSSQWNTSGTAIYYSAGNVGVGTTNPLVPLTVKSITNDEALTVRETDDGNQAVRIGANASRGFIQLYENGAAKVEFNALTSGGVNYINSGNVGIGTTGPGFKLQVGNGNVTGVNSTFEIVAAGGDIDSGVAAVSGAGKIAYLYACATCDGGVGFFGLSAYDYGLSTVLPIKIGGAVTVATSGNVGIGTTNPVTFLTISGAAPANGEMLVVNSTNGEGRMQLNSLTNTAIMFNDDGIRDWMLESAGNANTFDFNDTNDLQAQIRMDASALNDDGWVTATIDYGEFMPKLNPQEAILPFEVVGIKNGKVTKDTDGATLYMITSSDAGIRGGNPIDKPRDHDENYIVVAYTGQVPVLVKGEVKEGDYLLPSGKHDGNAIAVSPKAVDFDTYKKAVGIVLNIVDEASYKDFDLERSDGGWEKELKRLFGRKGKYTIVNVAVGMK